ncbi:MAG: PEGA domain-containing protein [Bdellovibrionales bacterium]|nr:PEGA domain-containing protein [Bdellovibrionales bacterium]
MSKSLLLLVLCSVFSVQVFAEAGAPFFCEKSSYQEGEELYAVGIARASSASDARQKAFENAVRELNNYFNGDPLQASSIKTQRTYTSAKPDKNGEYFVCRLIKIDLANGQSEDIGQTSSFAIGKPKGQKSKVTFLSNPSGAVLSIDGKIIGRTNISLANVYTGNYTYKLELPGYEPLTGKFDPSNADIIAKRLRRSLATVKLRANFEQGVVRIGKQKYEVQNYTAELKLEVGRSHTLSMSAEAHSPGTQSINLGMSETNLTRQVYLEPMPARLKIDSNPSQAEVYLDGELIGKTPGEFQVRPGLRMLELKKKDHITAQKRVELEPGKLSETGVIKVTSRSEREIYLEEEAQLGGFTFDMTNHLFSEVNEFSVGLGGFFGKKFSQKAYYYGALNYQIGDIGYNEDEEFALFDETVVTSSFTGILASAGVGYKLTPFIDVTAEVGYVSGTVLTRTTTFGLTGDTINEETTSVGTPFYGAGIMFDWGNSYGVLLRSGLLGRVTTSADGVSGQASMSFRIIESVAVF